MAEMKPTSAEVETQQHLSKGEYLHRLVVVPYFEYKESILYTSNFLMPNVWQISLTL